MGINVTSYTSVNGQTVWGERQVGMSYSNGMRTLRMLGLTEELESLSEESYAQVNPQTLLDRLIARPATVKAETGMAQTSPGAMGDEAYYARVRPILILIADEAISTGAEKVQLS